LSAHNTNLSNKPAAGATGFGVSRDVERRELQEIPPSVRDDLSLYDSDISLPTLLHVE
jgi:hypothetical protein